MRGITRGVGDAAGAGLWDRRLGEHLSQLLDLGALLLDMLLLFDEVVSLYGECALKIF